MPLPFLLVFVSLGTLAYELGTQPLIDASANRPLTEEDKFETLKDRISVAFAEQFILSHCPLIAHFKAAVQRQGDNYGLVLAAVFSAIDAKIVSLFKSINNNAETDPTLSLALVLKASKSCNDLYSPLGSLWVGKKGPFSFETNKKLINWTPEFTGKTDGTIEYRAWKAVFWKLFIYPDPLKSWLNQ